MMMGDAEQSFAQLRGALAETSRQAEQRRDIAAAGLATALAHMRLTFLALVSAGAAVSIAAALLIARAISRPTIRLTRTMAALAGGSVDVEIPDQRRRDEIGAMAKAVQVFKETMIGARRLADEQAAAGKAREQRTVRVEALARDFEAAIGKLTGAVASAAREMEATAGTMLSTADQTDQRSATVAAAAEQTSANVQTVATAAEELAASVREISVQAAQSAKTAGRAVEDARHTDARCRPDVRRAKDRRGGDDHPRHRQPDQPAGAQRDDRGGTRRRGRQGIRGGGLRGEGARQPDRQGDRGDRRTDRANPGGDTAGGRGHPGHHRHDRRDRPDRRRL